jgi:hypothetical protein
MKKSVVRSPQSTMKDLSCTTGRDPCLTDRPAPWCPNSRAQYLTGKPIARPERGLLPNGPRDDFARFRP